MAGGTEDALADTCWRCNSLETASGLHAVWGASWVDEPTKLREEIRVRHYSAKTKNIENIGELLWVDQEVSDFCPEQVTCIARHRRCQTLSDVAGDGKRCRSFDTESGIQCAVVFYRHVLVREFGEVDGVVRAKRRKYVPVVLSREEIDTVISKLEFPFDLVGKLLYGCGLHIS